MTDDEIRAVAAALVREYGQETFCRFHGDAGLVAMFVYPHNTIGWIPATWPMTWIDSTALLDAIDAAQDEDDSLKRGQE